MRRQRITKLLSPIDELTSDGEQHIVENLQRTIDIRLTRTKYSGLYLGTAIPTNHRKGIDSIQEPLSKQYPINGNQSIRGIEVWIIIDEHSLQIQFVSDPTIVLYYPIRSLVYCASVRFATQTQSKTKFINGYRFIPLDKPDASLAINAQNPPLFSVVFQRTRYSPIDECHSFVVKTKQIAFALVQACAEAYHKTDEQQDCSKVPLYFKINEQGTYMNEIDDEIITVPANKYEQIEDYQTNRKSTGLFYKTAHVQLGKWQLAENPKNNLRRSMSVQSINKTRHQRHRQSNLNLSDYSETKYRRSSSEIDNIIYEQSYFSSPQYFISPTYPSYEIPYQSSSSFWFYV